jgi:hypothetical protein
MRIKKAQLGAAIKTAAKSAGKNAKKVSSSSNKISKSKIASEFPEFSQNFMTTKPSGQRMKDQIRFDYTGKKAKYKAGGKLAKAKSGKSFPDLNKDGKITKADILKGRGVIKNGGKLKKARGGATLAPSKSSTSNRLASYGRPLGKNLKKAQMGTTTPSQMRARTAASIGRQASTMRKARTAARPIMKMGGKCRGGCY